MTRVKIRHATLDDFVSWHGETPLKTVRGWVAEVDGKPAAFAGFVLHPGFVETFSSFNPAEPLPPALVYRNAVKLFDEMKKYRLPLMAAADPARKNSGKFLEKLGFVLREKSPTGDIYQWN